MAHHRILAVFARLRWRSLEWRLASGEDPIHDRLLFERAAQIGTPKARMATAEQLERAIEAAAEPPRRFSGAVPVAREEVLRAMPVLLELIARLRDGVPAWPTGVAVVRRLLFDGAGPLYAPAHPGALRREADQARSALDREIGSRSLVG
jgi:hypothetical protein